MLRFHVVAALGCSALYVGALLLLFRRLLVSGVRFTPFVVANLFLLVIVAPAFFLEAAFGDGQDPFTLLVFISAFGFMTLGYLGTPKIRLRLRRSVNRNGEGILSGLERAEGFVALALAVILIILGLRYFDGLPGTVPALIGLVGGDMGDLARELQMQRLELTKGAYFGQEDRAQGLNTTLQRIGWSMLIAYCVTTLTLHGGVKRTVALLATLIAAWVFVAGTGARAPFLIAGFTGVIAYSLVKPLPLRTVVVMALGMICVGIFLGSYTHRMSDLFIDNEGGMFVAIQEIFGRLVLGNGSNDVLAIQLKRSGVLQSDFAQYHVRDFISALPGIQGGMPLAYHLTEIVGGGRTTFRSGTYVGTVFIDFGLLGIAGIFWLIGATLRVFHTHMFPVRRSAWQIAVIAITVNNLTLIITGGFHSLIAASVLTYGILAALWGVALVPTAMRRIGRRYHYPASLHPSSRRESGIETQAHRFPGSQVPHKPSRLS